MNDRAMARARALNALASLQNGEWDPWLGQEPEGWETHKEEITSVVRWNLAQVIPESDIDFFMTKYTYGTSYEEWLKGFLNGGVELAARDFDEYGGDNACNRRDQNSLPMTLLLCSAVSALTTVLIKCVISLIG